MDILELECSGCRRSLPEDQFCRNKNHAHRRGRDYACKDCARKERREYYAKNKERLLKYFSERRRTPAYRKRHREYAKRRYHEVRSEMLAAYGGRCTCCGETEPAFLTIEHVNQDGASHRRLLSSPAGVIPDLKKRGWPKDGFTLHCWNCNAANYFSGGCPHRKK